MACRNSPTCFGTDGGTANLSGKSATGGNTHFSANLLTAGLAVNRAPVLNATALTLSASPENGPTPAVSVGKLLAKASDSDRGALKGVALSGVGNSKTAQCVTSFGVKGTYNIVASYSGDGTNPPSASGPLSELVKGL